MRVAVRDLLFVPCFHLDDGGSTRGWFYRKGEKKKKKEKEENKQKRKKLQDSWYLHFSG